MFRFIKDLKITVIEKENARIEDFDNLNVAAWDSDTYRMFFKACNVKQKVEVFDKIKSMKALLINFKDDEDEHHVFMPADRSGQEFY